MINFAHTNGYTNKIYILNAKNHKSKILTDTERQKEALERIRQRYFEELGAIYMTCPNGFTVLCDALSEITYPKLYS